MEIQPDGRILDDNRNQIGYHQAEVIYSGGGISTIGGHQVGYLVGEEIYSGGVGTSGGHQVGYLVGEEIYSGGVGTSGGHLYGKAEYPEPRLRAAIKMLLG
ncbi:MAG: hypothetical protein ACR2MB_16875 [Acidimicrobiales bacterium]